MIDLITEVMYMKALCILLGIESISYWRCFESVTTLSSFQAETLYIFFSVSLYLAGQAT